MVTSLAQFQLTPQQVEPIIKTARNYSAIMQLGKQIPINVMGAKIPVLNGQTTATIVGENQVKPKYDPQIGFQFVQRSKFALISVLSMEAAREDPFGLVNLVKDEMGGAFARAIDVMGIYGGVSGQGYINQTSTSVELGSAAQNAGGTYRDIVSGLALQAGKNPPRQTTGYLWDQKAEPTLLASVDLQGRPLWVDAWTGENAAFHGTPGRMLGRPAYQVPQIAQGADMGWAGDWSKVVWGVYKAPNFRVVTDTAYTDSTGKLVSTTELNQILVIGEFEGTAACTDPDAFVRFTDATAPVVTS
ncbi:phage major capsid protein [Amycolatopsis sp. AA4]|uniref:phage major capsid protein n=1 Tax=Actinomycetes TaxID=1760 RepID=UPI0001B54ADB|nr:MULTISPECIES: phage major capsid protein [Actinomycetes]ATY11571.1 phage major capsid protein [Amycolatopsis sp. AA4]EFL07214.1 predicted protein [Streptomyces sp. AA4]